MERSIYTHVCLSIFIHLPYLPIYPIEATFSNHKHFFFFFTTIGYSIETRKDSVCGVCVSEWRERERGVELGMVWYSIV